MSAANKKYYSNKTVWITGASAGIGEGLAYAFSKVGARLIISARRKEELERVKSNCVKQSSINANDILVVQMDMSQHDLIPAKVKTVLEHFGKIDILINNAGISQRSLVKDTVFDVDKRIIDVNYLGVVALTKAVLPNMLMHNVGHLVVISSLVGKFGTPYRSAYAASKHALHGFFDSLRAELHTTLIKVTIICPSFVNTNISKQALIGDGRRQLRKDSIFGKKGLTVENAVQKMLRAIRLQKHEVYMGTKTYAVWIKRFFPRLFARIIPKSKVK